MPINTIDQPLVTVIIPTYNLGNYITQALESVFVQTYKHLEVIVIDDGSEDDTQTTISPFMSKITYVFQDNQGISKSYNRAISMARGQYICFLEADDYWITDDKVEKQVELLRDEPSLDYVHTGWQEVNAEGEIEFVSTPWTKMPTLTLDDWLIHSPIRIQALMVTRQCLQNIGGFNTHYLYAMDTELLLNIVNHKYQGIWLQEVTTSYRIHSESTSHQKRVEQAQESIEIFEYFINQDPAITTINGDQKKLLFFIHLYFSTKVLSTKSVDDTVPFLKSAVSLFWVNREFGIFDLATYLADTISYTTHKFDRYSEMVTALKQTFNVSDKLYLSSRLIVITDDLLHWWSCIWWRYYHIITPENKETDLYRYESIFKPYSITYYCGKSVDDIIYFARISIYISPLKFNENTLPTIQLFWNEMTNLNILSKNDRDHLIILYFAVALRALYFGQWIYVKQAIYKAIQHTSIKNVHQYGRFSLSIIGYIIRRFSNI